MAKLKSKKTKK
jgi:hypothetical protein